MFASCMCTVHVTNLRLFNKTPGKWGVMTRQGMMWEYPFFLYKLLPHLVFSGSQSNREIVLLAFLWS